MNPTQKQFDPNEIVTLTWDDGRVEAVPRTRLKEFDLPDNFQSGADTYANQVRAGVIAPDSANIPQKYRTGMLQILQREGFDSTSQDELKKEREGKTVKKEAADKAKAVLDVIAKGERGQLTGDKYRDQLNAAVSQYTASTAFGEGGKNLTATELSVLTGQVPVIEKRTGTPAEKFIAFMQGREVPQTGEVVDSEQQIVNKLEFVLSQLDPQEKERFFKQNPELLQLSKKVDSNNLLYGGTREANLERGKQIVSNIPKDAQRIGQGLLESGKQFVGGLASGKTKEQMIAEALPQMVKGTAESYGRMFTDPEYNAEHPVEAALNIAGIVGPATGLSKWANAAKAGTATEALPKIEAAAQAAQKGGKAAALRTAAQEETAGRLATQVAAPDTTSVIRSEKLMKDALQTTNSKTRRGMARELETNIAKIGDNTTSYIKDLDNVVGQMQKDEIIGSIDETLSRNTPESYRPELEQVMKNVNKDLGTGDTVGDITTEGTTLSKINEARIKLNKEIPSRWFENGMPTASRADVMNAIKWDVSNQLKKLLGEADETGYINRALEIQHTGYQTAPVLSKQALTNMSQGAAGFWGMVRSAWDKATTAPTIVGARKAQGAADPLTQQIMRGELPEISAPSAQMASPTSPSMPTIQSSTIPQVKSPGGGTTVVGERLGGKTLVNTKDIRYIKDKKGKVTGIEMKDNSGKWVEYKPSVRNFRQK